MIEILSLPNEILYDIASYLLAPDLASFLLCSRHLATLCSPILQRMQKAILAASDTACFAAKRGHVPLLRLFLANAPNGYDDAVMHVAAWYGRTEIINLLLLHGADVDEYDTENSTPLQYAIGNHKIDSVIALLKAGAQIKGLKGGTPPLYMAMQKPHRAIAQLLVNCGAPMDRFIQRRVWLMYENDPGGNVVVELIRKETSHLDGLKALNEHPWPPVEISEWPPVGKMEEGDMIIPWWFELHDEGGMGWELRSGVVVPTWLDIRIKWLEQSWPPVEQTPWPTDEETEMYGSL